MPYIDTKLSTTLTKEKELVLKTALGKMIENFPGKTESWLMLNFEGDCHLWFKGTDEPCAYVNIAIFGKGSDEAYNKMTADVCELLHKETGISPDRIYVRYEEVFHWGWNGSNF